MAERSSARCLEAIAILLSKAGGGLNLTCDRGKLGRPDTWVANLNYGEFSVGDGSSASEALNKALDAAGVG